MDEMNRVERPANQSPCPTEKGTRAGLSLMVATQESSRGSQILWFLKSGPGWFCVCMEVPTADTLTANSVKKKKITVQAEYTTHED